MQYLIILSLSFIFSLVLTSLFRKIGLAYGFCDRPEIDSLKVHREPIPYLGGLAMMGSFLVSILAGKILFNLDIEKVLAIFGVVFFLWIFGFIDDYKWTKRSAKNTFLKFFFQIIAAIIFVSVLKNFGFILQIWENSYLDFGILAIFFLLLHNAVNFEDGLDGLLGGVAIISAAAFFFIFWASGNFVGVLVSLALLGSVAGFLVFNFPPAKIFMGNNGSYLVGAVLIFLSLNFIPSFNPKLIFSSLLLIGMPVLNGIFVFIRRMARRQSIMAGDRHHLYDEIFYKFPPLRKTIYINWSIHLLLVISGILIVRYLV